MKIFQNKMFSWLNNIANEKDGVSAMTLVYCEMLSGLITNKKYGDPDVFDENVFDAFYLFPTEDEDYVSGVFDALVSGILHASESQEVEDLDVNNGYNEEEEEEEEEENEKEEEEEENEEDD